MSLSRKDKDFMRTNKAFSVIRGFHNFGFILKEFGFHNSPREMAFTTREELMDHIDDILDYWEFPE